MVRRDPGGEAVDIVVEGDDVSALTRDAEMVRAAMLNLLINAAQAMGGQGRDRGDAERAAADATI